MGFLPPLSLVANIQVEKVKLLPSHTYTITVWKLLLWKPLNAKVFGIDSMCYEWQMKKKNGIHVHRILSLIRVDRMSSKFCCCCVFGCPRRRCILACITTKPHVSRTHKATFHTHTHAGIATPTLAIAQMLVTYSILFGANFPLFPCSLASLVRACYVVYFFSSCHFLFFAIPLLFFRRRCYSTFHVTQTKRWNANWIHIFCCAISGKMLHELCYCVELVFPLVLCCDVRRSSPSAFITAFFQS